MKRRVAAATTPTSSIGAAARIKSLEKQLVDAEEKAADLEVEIKEANSKYAEATRRMVDLEEDLDDQLETKKSLEANIAKAESAEQRVAAAEKVRSVAAQRVQALQKEVAELRAKAKVAPMPAPAPTPAPALGGDPAAATKLAAAQKELTDATRKQAELAQRLTQLTKKNIELTQQVTDEKKVAVDLTQQLNAQTRRVNELQKLAKSQAGGSSVADAGRERELISLRSALETARETARQERAKTDKLSSELLEATKRLDEADRERQASSKLRCPRCGGKMVEFDHLGVTLDRCGECDGLYFDAGELEEVLHAEFPESFVVGDESGEVEIGSAQGGEGFQEDEDTFVEEEEPPRRRGSGFFKSLFKRKKTEE